MDRNTRSSYINSGTRSLPHMTKRHPHSHSSRLSPPAQVPQNHSVTHHSVTHHSVTHHSVPHHSVPHHGNNNGNGSSVSQHDDLIHYIYDSWNKVTRELERGNDSDARYYQEVMTPRQLANFRPFNLDEWWGRRLYTLKCKHRS